MHHNKMFWHYYEASLAHSWARLTKGFAYCEPFFLFQGRKLLAHLAHSIHSTRTFFEHDGLAARLCCTNRVKDVPPLSPYAPSLQVL